MLSNVEIGRLFSINLNLGFGVYALKCFELSQANWCNVLSNSEVSKLGQITPIGGKNEILVSNENSVDIS